MSARVGADAVLTQGQKVVGHNSDVYSRVMFLSA